MATIAQRNGSVIECDRTPFLSSRFSQFVFYFIFAASVTGLGGSLLYHLIDALFIRTLIIQGHLVAFIYSRIIYYSYLSSTLTHIVSHTTHTLISN